MKRCDKINVLQHFIVKPIMESNAVTSSEKTCHKRQTSSVCLLDETAVFSDTEDEEEYNKRLFNDLNLTVLPKIPKRRHVEIQCDIPIESDILNLIKVCSTLNINIDSDLVELINLCKILAKKYYGKDPENKHSKRIENEYGQEQQGLMDKLSEKGMPDPQPDISSTVVSPKTCTASEDFLPSRLGCVDSVNESIHSEINKDKMSVSTVYDIPYGKNQLQKKKEKKLQEIIPRRSTRRKAPENLDSCFTLIGNKKQHMVQDKKNILEDKRESTEIEKDSLFTKPKQQPRKLRYKNQDSIKSVTGTLDNNPGQVAEKSVPTVENKLYQNYPPRMIKRLARSWVNPNKSLDCELMVHTNENMPPTYVSLQHTNKLRRLYSPTEWLSSQDFEKACPPVTNSIRTIFS